MQYSLHTINGLTIILAPLAGSRSTTVEVMVKAGSIYEKVCTNGLSHFLEHMFFKGGTKYQTPRDVVLSLDAIGANFNAYTSDEYARYYVTCAPSFVSSAVDVLSDMLCHAAFPEPELEREKGVITQEIMMYHDDPASLVQEKWAHSYYGDNPYGRSTLGPIENVQSFVRDDLLAHKQALYTKDNLVIVVAGAIDDERAMLDLISSSFGDLPNHRSISAPVFEGVTSKENDHYAKNTEQNHLIISLPGVSGDHPDKYALQTLTTALGGTMSSRLFQRIREQEGLCYYIGAGHSASVDYGTTYLSAGVDKQRFEHAHARMTEELTTIARDGIDHDEFDSILNYLRGKTHISCETSSQVASYLGKQQLLYGSIETPDDKLQQYESLTLDQVNACASYLDPEKMFSYRIE